jgi:hypothetical protein
MTNRAQHGGALVETVVALAILTAVTGMAIAVLARTSKLSAAGRGETERLWSRAKAERELASAEYAAADLAYFDLTATVDALRRGGESTGAAANRSTPPSGYCGPVDPADTTTWPSGFDPNDRATWTTVTWWSGLVRSDPTTWFYDCSSPVEPGPRRLTPVFSYGDGVVLGGKLNIVGPAAVTPESAPLFGDQVGDSLTLIRSAAGRGPFQLGDAFDSASAVIRLMARDSTSVAQVEGLLAGEVLVVTGRDSSGIVATALAELQEAPHQVSIPSPTDDRGEVIVRYYEARVSTPEATVRWGLANAGRATTGVSILADAAVALLDGDAGVVSFYTARDVDGTLTLFKVIGDPRTPERRDALVTHAATSLVARLETTTTSDASGTRTLATALEATMVVASEAPTPSEPVHSRVEFIGAAHSPRRIGLHYGEFEITTPLPPPTQPPLQIPGEGS